MSWAGDSILVADDDDGAIGPSFAKAIQQQVREELLESLGELGVKGPALVVRAGGGRTGETFSPGGDRTTIGRSPDCGVFLDDVTVSRRHAALVQRDGRWVIEDLGSLNGTFLNRHRIESGQLNDGDELQIGKYRLTFLLK